MRLIDLIVRTWRFRQEIQSQYEKALPQSKVNKAVLEATDEPKRSDRRIDKPDVLTYFGIRKDQLPDRQKYTLDATAIDTQQAYLRNEDGSLVIEQNGVIPAGTRRHAGIVLWLWLCDRLRRAEIVLELEDPVFAALDQEGFCQDVADLSAEMRLDRTDVAPLDRKWIVDIETRVDNEALAEEILTDIYNTFGQKMDAVEERPQPLIAAQPGDYQIPREVLQPVKQEVEIER
jgi:hypothetical protein